MLSGDLFILLLYFPDALNWALIILVCPDIDWIIPRCAYYKYSTEYLFWNFRNADFCDFLTRVVFLGNGLIITSGLLELPNYKLQQLFQYLHHRCCQYRDMNLGSQSSYILRGKLCWLVSFSKRSSAHFSDVKATDCHSQCAHAKNDSFFNNALTTRPSSSTTSKGIEPSR